MVERGGTSGACYVVCIGDLKPPRDVLSLKIVGGHNFVHSYSNGGRNYQYEQLAGWRDILKGICNFFVDSTTEL